MFAWCDVNLFNGLLYTSNYTDADRLYAYDASATADGVLPRRADQDLVLRQGPVPTTSIQSSCFTPNYRVLMVCDVEVTGP